MNYEQQYNNSNQGFFPEEAAAQQYEEQIKDQLDFIKTLLDKKSFADTIPDEMNLKPFLHAWVKNLAISNFSNSDITYIMNSFDDAKNASLMALPPGRYSWELEHYYSLMRPLIFAEAKRSLNGFERKMQVSSISQNISQTMGSNTEVQASSGLFGKVKRMIGGGRR